jgi:hypothetical protein
VAAGELLDLLDNLEKALGDAIMRPPFSSDPMPQEWMPAGRRALRRMARHAKDAEDLATDVLAALSAPKPAALETALDRCEGIGMAAASTLTYLAEVLPNDTAAHLLLTEYAVRCLSEAIRKALAEQTALRMPPSALPLATNPEEEEAGPLAGALTGAWLMTEEAEAGFHQLCRLAAPILPLSDKDRAGDPAVAPFVVTLAFELLHPAQFVAALKAKLGIRPSEAPAAEEAKSNGN